ncbi:MAG: hypothetical protein OS112_04060 [Methanoregula sp.]|nr:MAG: hypothetical protein OS112_04060 [Methanoregula sp.]
MADPVITEYAGTKRGSIFRYYQYGSGGVRVLDERKILRRLYLFDHASDMMTERDPARQEKVVRRFLFDRYGMLEETFSFGQSPRTFRYENGGQQIAVREGGQYGAVGKTFTFEGTGISETAWGRHGEIERVYIFEPTRDTITERAGGWYGTVDRTLVFEGIDASVFREPEAFLQFYVFTEQHEGEADAGRRGIPEDTGRREGAPLMARSRFAFTGKRHSSSDTRPGSGDETRLDFIPDGDTVPKDTPRQDPSRKKSSEISFAERLGERKT